MKTVNHYRVLWLIGAAMLLIGLACNLPLRGGGTASPTPGGTASAAGTGTSTPMVMCTPPACQEGEVYYCPGDCPGGCGTQCATPTAVPATEVATPSPTTAPSGPTATPVCSRSAKYVSDVTVPDDSIFPPGASFVKTWRVRNTGTCAWEAGTKLVYVSGEAMSGPATVDVTPAGAGAEVDVSVNMVAPSTPGKYRGNWQLRAPDGKRFGPVLYVRIIVQAATTATVTPTVTTTPMVTPTVTVTPTPTTSACVTVDPALQPVLTYAVGLGHDPGCPTQAAFVISGAFQTFWANVDNVNPHMHFRSLMIWRSDSHKIYVIDGKDTDVSQGALTIYNDTWAEGQPPVHPNCASMTPPQGYQLPVRGFGKVWCTNALWGPVGWPSDPEAAVTLLVQPTEHGRLMKVSGPIATGYLIAMVDSEAWAGTLMTSP